MKVFEYQKNKKLYKIYHNIIRCLCQKCSAKYQAVPLMEYNSLGEKLESIFINDLNDFVEIGEI